jgi:hypothetical protein
MMAAAAARLAPLALLALALAAGVTGYLVVTPLRLSPVQALALAIMQVLLCTAVGLAHPWPRLQTMALLVAAPLGGATTAPAAQLASVSGFAWAIPGAVGATAALCGATVAGVAAGRLRVTSQPRALLVASASILALLGANVLLDGALPTWLLELASAASLCGLLVRPVSLGLWFVHRAAAAPSIAAEGFVLLQSLYLALLDLLLAASAV